MKNTFKNTTELLKVTCWVIHAFESGLFPMKAINVADAADDDDYDDPFTYGDEFYLEQTLIPRNPTTAPVILDPP